MEKDSKQVDLVKKVLQLEAQSIEAASKKINNNLIEKTQALFRNAVKSKGSLHFCGVGKSGFVAKKLASTFSSLGIPSFFLHPVEALHGDLGKVRESDIVFLISKSGTAEEILKLLPFLPVKKEALIGLVGSVNSPIANASAVVFDCGVDKEACLNNQAPTTSTTVAMAVGDALAVLFEDIVGLSKENFAVNHPGGILGKSLRMKVSDLMWSGDHCPKVDSSSKLEDVILEMTNRPVGGCAVVDSEDNLIGIIVEGDIRRTFLDKSKGLQTSVVEILNATPISISPDSLASKALELMQKRTKPIDILPVISNKKFLGFIRWYDLLKEGFSKE